MLGVLIERFAYKPLRARRPVWPVLITAIGVSYFLQNAAQLIWSSGPKNFTSIVTFRASAVWRGPDSWWCTGEADTIPSLACVIIMVGLTRFTTRTRTGKAMQCRVRGSGTLPSSWASTLTRPFP